MVSIRVRHLVLVSAAVALIVPAVPTRAEQTQKPPQPPAPQTATRERDWTGDIPAHLSRVEGSVTLERERTFEPAELNAPLLAGDQIVTKRGRVEVLFADGSTVTIDEESEVEFLSDSLVKLDQGRIRIRIQRTTKELEYRVDSAAGTVWIDQPGEYRVQLSVDRHGDTEVDLAVFRGAAELVNDLGSTIVRAGAGSVATAATAPSKPFAVNSAAADDFDRWSEDARNARVGGTHSVQYLPEEVRSYSNTFDSYGSWDYYEPAGSYVWYPTVSTGWYPYWQGRWSYTNYYGWFWVGIDYWSWPTHHYGYWGINHGRWYWAPGSYWAPAWVSWYSAPGYVGWCPLGYGGVPVVAFHSPYYNAWTVIPAYTWNHNVWVTPHVVPYGTLSPSVVGTFAAVTKAPRPVNQGLPVRDAPPLRGPVDNTSTTTPKNTVPDRGALDSARVPSRTSDTTPRSVIRGGGTPTPQNSTSPRNSLANAPAPVRAPATPSPDARASGGTRNVAPEPRYSRSADPDRATPTRPDPVDRQASGVDRQSTPRNNVTAPADRSDRVYRSNDVQPSRPAPPTVRQAPPRYDAQPNPPAGNYSAGRPSPPAASAPPPKSSGPPASYSPPSRPSQPSGPPPSAAAPSRNAPPSGGGTPSAAPPSRSAPPANAAPPPARSSGGQGGGGGGGGGKGRGGK